MVQKLAAIPLAFQPGSGWRYSVAHDVIGYLVRRISDRMITTNQLPDELVPIGFEDPWPGIGYGFGFGVVVDPGQQTVRESEGTFFWGGHAGTSVRIDPRQELIGLIMPQALHYGEPSSTLRPLIYQAIID